MLRRRLRLSYSSEEENDVEPQSHQQTVQNDVTSPNPQSETLNNNSPNSNPNPNPNNSNPPQNIDISSDEEFIDVSDNLSTSSLSPDNPIAAFLLNLGLRLRTEWLDSCVNGLENSVQGFSNLDVSEKAKSCFGEFLYSDMNYCGGGGVLPDNVGGLHLVDLPGPFVLQVDEIVNISCPLRGRYQNAASGIKRCLKLSMTDGVQRVFGMEYRPIKDLEVLAPAGMKVSIRNVHIRHGLLMLVPEVIEVLGGLVEELDTARQRLVHELNKPPRGRRTRSGVVVPLATRATHAAWPSTAVNGVSQTSGGALQNSNSFRPSDNGTLGASMPRSSMDTRASEESVFTISRENSELNHSVNAVASADDIHMADEVEPVPRDRENVVPNRSMDAATPVQDIPMVDEVEHRVMLSGDKEIPFTYMASLSAKWAGVKEFTPSVQGKIKCFLTGVKGFQYKQRSTFELRVYIDDGSLISEILIDHSVVLKGVGHCPEEVTAALSSSDAKTVSGMKETMRQFQIFLANFEGTMLIEMNESSPTPVALEMNQGSPASEAWLLLRRLKTYPSGQTQLSSNVVPIDLSP